jgi:hypothetical protein
MPLPPLLLSGSPSLSLSPGVPAAGSELVVPPLRPEGESVGMPGGLTRQAMWSSSKSTRSRSAGGMAAATLYLLAASMTALLCSPLSAC